MVLEGGFTLNHEGEPEKDHSSPGPGERGGPGSGRRQPQTKARVFQDRSESCYTQLQDLVEVAVASSGHLGCGGPGPGERVGCGGSPARMESSRLRLGSSKTDLEVAMGLEGAVGMGLGGGNTQQWFLKEGSH